MSNEEILEIFKFFYDGNLIPISFGLLVVYFIFRKKISFIKYKAISDIFVIAFFIFSIDIALFPHRYFNLIKNYVVVKQDILNTTNYSTDLQFVINTYASNKLDNLVKFNVKDEVLEEFKYIKDVKK